MPSWVERMFLEIQELGIRVQVPTTAASPAAGAEVPQIGIPTDLPSLARALTPTGC